LAALASGAPIPARLPPDTPLLEVPNGLVKILDRDLVAAGIARRVKAGDRWVIDKCDDRSRSLDVHALRTTFGTLLSKGGVAPRTAQAVMRHSDIKLTMGVYTDPKLLDGRGALDALPSPPLTGGPAGDPEAMAPTGTDGGAARTLAPTLAPTPDNRDPKPSHAVNPSTDGVPATFAASGSPDKRKGPLSADDSGPSCRGDWIRTSDLLNPIQEGVSPDMRKILAFSALAISTLFTV
jgi:hypothetical protein